MNYLVQIPVNHAGHNTCVDQFSADSMERVLTVSGQIDDGMAECFNSAVRALVRSGKEPITVYVNSPGGSVSAGMSMLDTLNASGCEINTVASGMAASMGAFLVALAGSKGHRWCKPNAELMIHQPLGGAQGQATDIHIAAEHILVVRNKINQMLSEATNQPIEKIAVDTERDYFLDAHAALAYGLIDKIGDPMMNNNKEG